MTLPLLSVDNLSLSFGDTTVVNRTTFSIHKGEILAVVGESGSGKSITALSCLGLQPANASVSGSITFDGQQLVGASNATLRQIRGKRISMIFQEPMTALNPLHTIKHQIAEMFTASPSEEQTMELLTEVGLSHFGDRLNAYPHQLSGGERQRVMIAMAIANNPDLLIADEPTTAVDVTLQLKIIKLLKALQQKTGMAILFITHDLTIVRRLADRVVVMSKGEIVEQGAVLQTFSYPTHPYTQHLLASEPKGSAVPVPTDTKTLVACYKLSVCFKKEKKLFNFAQSYKNVLNSLSISIPESSTIGIVGESGSGKTTLGFALLRLVKSEGSITFLGKPIETLNNTSMRPLRKEMQMVFQDPFSSLNPRMTIRHILEEGLHVHFPKYTATQREEAIDAVLQDVGLPLESKDRYPHEFSGGQRQRISIARAIILRPRFVVLDEPTSALDLSIQSQLIDLLKDLQKKYGMSYLFISHDLRVIRAIAHYVIVLKEGSIVEQGSTEQIFSHPTHNYTKTLMEAAFLQDT